MRSRAWIWVTVAAFAVALLLSFGPWTTLGPTIAEEDYGCTGVFGLLAGRDGRRHDARRAGRLPLAAAAPDARRLHVDARRGRRSPWGSRSALPLPLLVPLFAAAGVGLALFGIWWETALAERVPPHTLSRVSSYDWMGSLALLPLGYLLAGPLGDALGPALVLGVGSALAALVLAGGDGRARELDAAAARAGLAGPLEHDDRDLAVGPALVAS